MNRKIQFFISFAVFIFAVIIFLFIVRKKETGISVQGKITEFFNVSWASDELWEDGLAEVAVYQAERSIYGDIRHYEYIFILVKETFNRAFQVKTDDYTRNDLFDVMKINKFARIETDRYPYHYLSSIFFTRNDPLHLYKFTNSSQEWCGNTFKYFINQENEYKYEYNSYWDNQGTGSTSLPPDVIFEDQLSYTLRSLNFREGLSFDCRIVETQVTNKATEPVIYEGIISIHKNKAYQPDLEDFRKDDIWEIRVKLNDEKMNTYWIAGKYPNELIQMVAWDGRRIELKHISREAYWLDK